MSATVTEQHREIAREVESGLLPEHVKYYEERNVERIAQAIADAEERGAKRMRDRVAILAEHYITVAAKSVELEIRAIHGNEPEPIL